MVITQWLSD